MDVGSNRAAGFVKETEDNWVKELKVLAKSKHRDRSLDRRSR